MKKNSIGREGGRQGGKGRAAHHITKVIILILPFFRWDFASCWSDAIAPPCCCSFSVPNTLKRWFCCHHRLASFWPPPPHHTTPHRPTIFLSLVSIVFVLPAFCISICFALIFEKMLVEQHWCDCLFTCLSCTALGVARVPHDTTTMNRFWLAGNILEGRLVVLYICAVQRIKLHNLLHMHTISRCRYGCCCRYFLCYFFFLHPPRFQSNSLVIERGVLNRSMQLSQQKLLDSGLNLGLDEED